MLAQILEEAWAISPDPRRDRLAAAFVTHAGHGSTLRPLMAGVPLLCLPMGRDQNDNAMRAAHRGAALNLSPDASPASRGSLARSRATRTQTRIRQHHRPVL